MSYRILGICGGNWKDLTRWSGVSYYFFSALKKRFKLTKIINGHFRLPALVKYKLSRQRYQKKSTLKYYATYAVFCKKKIERLKKRYNLIILFGLLYQVKENIPFVLYLDITMKLWYKFFNKFSPRQIYSYQHKKREVRKKWQLIKLQKEMFIAASKIFTRSDYVRRLIIRDYEIRPEKVITVGAGPNLKSLPKINKKYDGKTILFVGKDFVRKGGFILIKAFRKIRNELPDARLIIISSQLNKYYTSKKKISMEKLGIFIKGFSNKQTLGSWYRKASVFVMPSLYEPFGIVFLEAMAYKLPCIGTNKWAIPEIIEDGRTGFLVAPNDYNGLARKVIFLLKHKKIAKEMGLRGHGRVVNYFNWDRVVRQMGKHFNHIISKSQSYAR